MDLTLISLQWLMCHKPFNKYHKILPNVLAIGSDFCCYTLFKGINSNWSFYVPEKSQHYLLHKSGMFSLFENQGVSTVFLSQAHCVKPICKYSSPCISFLLLEILHECYINKLTSNRHVTLPGWLLAGQINFFESPFIAVYEINLQRGLTLKIEQRK